MMEPPDQRFGKRQAGGTQEKNLDNTFEAGMSMKTKAHRTQCPNKIRLLDLNFRHSTSNRALFCRELLPSHDRLSGHSDFRGSSVASWRYGSKRRRLGSSCAGWKPALHLKFGHHPQLTPFASRCYKGYRRVLEECIGTVGVAQLVERQTVDLDVAGSNPVTHPKRNMRARIAG